MNIKCENSEKCKRFDTESCASCIHNKLEDFFKEIEEGKDDEDEIEEEKEELAEKVAKHPEFKNHSEKDDFKFIEKHFPEIIDEWEDLAVMEIAESAREIVDETS